MANPYVGTKISGCNSPTIGNDRSTYVSVIDTAMSAIDNHDHTNGKGTPIGAGGIANGAVGSAQIAAQGVATSNIANGAVGSAQIAAQGVATSNIANGAVGLGQLATSNKVVSASSSAFQATNTTADVTGLSCAITTTGGDVEISIIPAVFSATASSLGPSASNFFLSVFRGATEIIRVSIGSSGMTLGTRFTDFAPAAGAYTYKLQVNTNGNQTVFVTNCVLVVKEVK